MPRIENLEAEIENRRNRLLSNTERMPTLQNSEVFMTVEIARRDAAFFYSADDGAEGYRNSPLFNFNEHK